ncbi:unnamed protein product [Brassica oleracea]
MMKDVFRPTKSAPCSPAKLLGISHTRSESFHAIHKVPVGDSPYVRAKNVQMDPKRAIPLFWSAINARDRVDSALKDMAIVMKQQDRAEEAIEAIKSLRVRCSDQAQESLDNILLDLYKVLTLQQKQNILCFFLCFLLQLLDSISGEEVSIFCGTRSHTATGELRMGFDAKRQLHNKEFEEAMIMTVLGTETKVVDKKRLKVF